jgi:thioredoxin-like negative regulator of GroEL
MRLVRGLGQKKPEALTSRQAVVRVLIEAAADLLLRRISSERAEEIRVRVDQLLQLFDRVDRSPQLVPALRRRLDELEALMRETRRLQTRRAK